MAYLFGRLLLYVTNFCLSFSDTRNPEQTSNSVNWCRRTTGAKILRMFQYRKMPVSERHLEAVEYVLMVMAGDALMRAEVQT